MKKHIRYIFILSGMLFVFSLSSCSFFDEPASCDDIDSSSSISAHRSGLMVFHLSTVSQSVGALRQDAPVEKIMSLRIIVLSDGFIEINEKVNDLPESLADETFSYSFKRESLEGKKEFFFIANEESIGEVSFEPVSGISLPAGFADGMNLSDIWSSFPADDIPVDENGNYDMSQGNGKGTDFKNILNAIRFNPTLGSYNVNEDSNTLYLPYSVYYGTFDIKLDEISGELHGLDNQVFSLVPVATKFEFQFINNRSNKVEISDLKVTKFDTSNFLYARVGTSDYEKTLPGETEELYWPDWLAKVAKTSWDNIGSSDENNTFNTLYGWITDYEIPRNSVPEVKTFPINEENPKFIVPGITKSKGEDEEDIEIPGETIIGPFYMPESKNMVSSKHWYGINFTAKDKGNNTEFKFENDSDGSPVGIENLGALFRNTHVVIRIKMGEGDPVVQGVYAELVPYNRKNAWGFVGDYVK